MHNEITTTQLHEVVQSSKIELTKAEAIAANYAPILAEVQAQMHLVKTLVKGEATHVEKAKRVRIDLGRIASKAAAQKKADKDDLLLQTRFIDALFNTVEGAARITQNEAKEIEEHFERLEAERKAALRAERWAALSEFMEHEPVGLDSMEQPVFDNLLSGAKFAHEAKLKAEQEAEAERLRLIEEQRIEQERIRQENERLKAEAAKQRAIIEKQRKEAEAARIAAERELQAKKDAEAKAERERLAEVERQRKEAEKLAKAPIKKQLTVWVDSFSIPQTTFSNDVSDSIIQKFEAFKAWAKTQIENL